MKLLQLLIDTYQILKNYSKKEKKKQNARKHWFGPKKCLSKWPVSLMYLITNLRISWLKLLEIADCESYNKKWI